MKKLILLVLFLALFPIQKTRAVEPIFGFGDGKFYDSSQTLKYICFLDNNCYDLTGKLAFKIVPVVQVPIDPTTPPALANVPIQSPAQAPSADPVTPPSSTAAAPAGTINVLETVYDGFTGAPSINGSNIPIITAKKGKDLATLATKVFNPKGIQLDSPIIVTTDDPDLPSTFTIKANTAFYVGDHHQSGVIQDTGNITSCDSTLGLGYHNDGCTPISVGTFNFTFTQPELDVTRSIQLIVLGN